MTANVSNGLKTSVIYIIMFDFQKRKGLHIWSKRKFFKTHICSYNFECSQVKVVFWFKHLFYAYVLINLIHTKVYSLSS